MVQGKALRARREVVFEGGKRKAFGLLLLAALVAAGLLLAARPAHAQTVFTVNDPSGLLEAIKQANVRPGHDFINVTEPGRLDINEEIRITDSVTIEGRNGVIIDQHGPGSVLVTSGENVVLKGLEITGADSGEAGIRNSGGLYLVNSTVHHNTAPTAGGVGSGIHNARGLVCDSGNCQTRVGILRLVNSTVSGNYPHGIFNEGAMDVYMSTITDNPQSGVFNVTSGPVTLGYTILAGNGLDAHGPFRTQGYNLIGTDAGSTGLVDGASDQIGTNAARIDPGLRPLDYNEPGSDVQGSDRGPTPTHPLRIDSPAVDAAGADCAIFVHVPISDPWTSPIKTDQRGISRPAGPACDIGAFERRPLPVIAEDDAYSTEEDTPLTVDAPGVLGNDHDWGSPIVVAEPRPASGPSHGTLELDADGSFAYTPDAGFAGTDSFTYKASHGGLLTSDAATVTITVEPAPPPNDDFSNAETIDGADVSVEGTTLAATRETGEPQHDFNDPDSGTWPGDHSVWYGWKAPASGSTTVDTCTAEIDSILAVYTGERLDNLTRVVDNNNGCASGWGSKVTFEASAGKTYRIAVGDAGGARENAFTLGVNAPADADPPEAPVITSPADNSYDTDGSFAVSGTAEAGSKVEIFEGDASEPLGAATTDGENWSINLVGVTEGSHTYTAEATDAAGNTSARSSALTVIVDRTAPTVRVIPAEGKSGVRRNTNVTATFSEAIDPKTLVTDPTDPASPKAGSSNTFTLTRAGATTAVPATVTVSEDGKTATLDPSVKLAARKTYTARIVGAKDAAGNQLSEKVWTFKTGRK